MKPPLQISSGFKLERKIFPLQEDDDFVFKMMTNVETICGKFFRKPVDHELKQMWALCIG